MTSITKITIFATGFKPQPNIMKTKITVMNLSEKEKKVAKKFILLCIVLGIFLGIRAAYRSSNTDKAAAPIEKTIK